VASGSGCQGPAPELTFAEVYVDPPLVKRLAGSPPDLESDIGSHAEFIAGRRLLTVALQRPEIARLVADSTSSTDSLAWLAGRFHVQTIAPNHLRIVYSGQPSSEGASLVNGIASAYIDEMRDMTARLRAERIGELAGALHDVASRLREKRMAIRRLADLLAAPAADSAETDPTKVAQAQARTTEFDTLQKAVVQGDEIEARLAAELAELQREPRQPGVGLIRMAELR
jgi:hypothetical protein